MNIDVFTKYNCPPCKFLKVWLNKNGIRYNEKPLETKKNMNEFIERKGSGYPLIVIKEEKGEKVFLGNTMKLKKYLREHYLQ
ncbi:glutaredoxin domain-containing protein [Shouchella sp. 1P09AA]|uniref:glutaredoxin family protein n=1 Tax=unclassified Shouchella TaxID=2893065 RepID=UPI0039A34D0E